MSNGSQGGIYEFGPFRVDVAEGLLLEGTEVVPLSPKAFEMLLVLVESNGRLLSKDELLRRVWPDTFVEEGNLAHHVFTLRKVLEKDGARFIETVPKRGYRFVAEVRSLAARPAGGAKPRSRRAVFAAALVILTVAAGSVTFFVRKEGGDGAGRPRVIAILPFRPLVASERDESLELGMADTLITKLGAVRQIESRPIGVVRK